MGGYDPGVEAGAVNLFDWMLMGHVAGDWLLQTSAQAAGKVRSGRARLGHVAVWWLALMASEAAWWTAARPSGIAGLEFLAAVCTLLAVLHFLQDSRRPVLWFCRVVKGMAPDAQHGWLVIAVDQGLHLLQIGLAAAVLTAALLPRG
jgi:hypothetical protein